MARLALVVAVVGGVSALTAQGPAPALPSFDVVSIKRNDSDGGSMRVEYQRNALVVVNAPIATLIHGAYPSETNELVAAPAWLESDRYDVTARAEGEISRDDIPAMLQRLLADRLKLTVHYETQERPVYALRLARDDGRLGPEMRLSEFDCEAINAARRATPAVAGPTASNGASACGMSVGGGVMRIGGLPIARLLPLISGTAGRVIVDKTGLTGNYEFTLRFARQPNAGDDTPSLFTALEEQLGLRLVPDQAPVRMLVIDSVERPTPN